MLLRAFIKYKFELGVVTDLWVWSVGIFLVVKNYFLGAMLLASYNFPILAINVTEETHWFWGKGEGLGERIALIGALIGLLYKFLSFVSPRFKRFWKNFRRK